MKIAFFGLPLAALLLDHDGHDLVSVACPRDDALGLRRARRRFGDRFLLKPKVDAPSFHEKIRRAKPDLLVSWFWTTLLPESLLSIAPLGTVGVHPSLLPRHRGPDPYFWAIDSGDTETGVTAHRLAREYDTGAILGKKTLAIDPSWDSWKLAKALDRPSLALLREVARTISIGALPDEVTQDEALATLAPAPDDALCAIRFDVPTSQLLRRIRALAPTPGAYTEIGDVMVLVTAAEPAVSFPASLLAGEAAVVGDRAVVRTADGAVSLLRGELDEGDPPPRLGPADFVDLVRSALAPA